MHDHLRCFGNPTSITKNESTKAMNAEVVDHDTVLVPPDVIWFKQNVSCDGNVLRSSRRVTN